MFFNFYCICLIVLSSNNNKEVFRLAIFFFFTSELVNLYIYFCVSHFKFISQMPTEHYLGTEKKNNWKIKKVFF